MMDLSSVIRHGMERGLPLPAKVGRSRASEYVLFSASMGNYKLYGVSLPFIAQLFTRMARYTYKGIVPISV
jgi:hypothetical protein